ncbi:putative odorant receptor 83c [Uranotaenia lowii]|uniref:putative odorant receptor 83c n=1 Tax=Uranotaenia lowii TaxID=190385 RepID=UPI002478C343|nr:putative odorant receptor 83c [Uranotaenia lowii]
MSSRKAAESFEAVLRWNQMLLEIFGINSYNPDFRMRLNTLALLLLASLFTAISVINLFLFRADSFAFIFVMVTLCFAVIGWSRVGYLLLDPSSFADVLNDAKRIYRDASQDPSTQQILLKYIAVLKRFAYIYATAVVIGSVGTTLLPFVVLLITGERTLPFGVLVPYTDVETENGYWINLFYQISCFIWTPPGMVGTVNIYFALIFSICVKYDILMLKLDEFDELILSNSNENQRSKINDAIVEIVKYHMSLIAFVDKIESLFSPQMLIEINCSALQIIVALFVMIIVFLGIFMGTFQMLLLCALGTLIDMKSDMFVYRIYNISWHLLKPSEQKSIQLILSKSQRPLILTYGGFAVLNMNFFVQVYKMIYSQFMLLQSM